MFLALGCGVGDGEHGLVTFAVIAAMFHLFTHAFFKALLFLGAGSVMHAMGDVIDMRRFSGLRKVHADHALDLPVRRRWPWPASRCCRASGARTRSSPPPYQASRRSGTTGTIYFVLLCRRPS